MGASCGEKQGQKELFYSEESARGKGKRLSPSFTRVYRPPTEYLSAQEWVSQEILLQVRQFKFKLFLCCGIHQIASGNRYLSTSLPLCNVRIIKLTDLPYRIVVKINERMYVMNMLWLRFCSCFFLLILLLFSSQPHSHKRAFP